MPKFKRKVETYRCQFCGHVAPEDEWVGDIICPNCDREYDAILAQEDDSRMSEKLASTEIAQSRERFEKEGLQLGLVLARDKDGGYKWALERIAWTIHLAAERDTRERCAQLARKSIDTTLAAASVTILSYEEVLDIAARTILGELDGN